MHSKSIHSACPGRCKREEQATQSKTGSPPITPGQVNPRGHTSLHALQTPPLEMNPGLQYTMQAYVSHAGVRYGAQAVPS